MSRKPLFAGLIEDEFGNPVDITYVGDEPCYVVNDAGFKRHISSEDVDRQVLDIMKEQIKGKEELISKQTAKMLGQEDLFTWAMIQSQLKNIDAQFENLLQTGIPEEGLAFMGMMGFRIVINVHGEVIRLEQPGTIDSDDED